MNKVIFSSTFSLIVAIWALNVSQAQDLPPTSQSETSKIPEQLTTDDLRQLLEILDESKEASKEVQKFQSHPLLHLGELLLDEEDDQQNASQKGVLESTTTPTTTTAMTTTTTPFTTPRPTPTTTPPPSQISRREDSTQTPAEQPSHEQLVQQLSLFNSLLMSLSVENATTPQPDGPPPMNEQQVALLKALFGNFTPLQTTEASQFLKRQTEPPSSPSSQTPSPSSPEIVALTELLTKIAKAPTDANGNLNLQSITGGSGVTPEHLRHFTVNNANMDAAASNQLSTLLNLLGTLGSLSQAQQQFQQPSTSLFNFGTTPTVAPISSNFLSGILNQPQAQASQTSPNIFGNLFNQQHHQPVAHEQQFNFGNLLTPGIGSVISTMSNIFGGGVGEKPRVRGKGVDTRLGLGYRFGDAADAQIMWDVGPGLFTEPLQNEPPRYSMTKKKRQNPPSPPPTQNIQAAAQAEKEQQQIAASRRYFQVHPSHRGQQNSYQSRKAFFINPPTTRKPFMSGSTNLTPYAQEQALKELWQMMEMKKQLQRMQAQPPKQSSNFQNYFNINNFTPAELFQIQRSKHVIKRAFTQSIPSPQSNPDPTRPTVDKNVDELLGSESFLRFRKMPPNPGNNGHYHPSSFSHKKSQQPQQRISPPQQSGGGLFNLNIFGRFRGPSATKQQKQPANGPRPGGGATNGGGMTGSQSQMGRWDMDNHRFDNFKNTNGELVMTDSNLKDRFYLRNNNPNGQLGGA